MSWLEFLQCLFIIHLLFFRLISEKGLPALRTLFEDVKFRGKGHEVITHFSLHPHHLCVRYWNTPELRCRYSNIDVYESMWSVSTVVSVRPLHLFLIQAENLKLLLQKTENWAHRLYPKMQFEEFIDKLESLGGKKEVQVRCLALMKKITLSWGKFKLN